MFLPEILYAKRRAVEVVKQPEKPKPEETPEAEKAAVAKEMKQVTHPGRRRPAMRKSKQK